MKTAEQEHYQPSSEIISFRRVNCCVCGTPFCMESQLNERRHSDGKLFYCPNGHDQLYRETDAVKLRKANEEIERQKQKIVKEQERTQFWQQEKRKADKATSAYKGQVTKIKRRVNAGVCPCCNRTFSNLAAHIKTKHKDFSKDEK